MLMNRIDAGRYESARGELRRDAAWRHERVSVAAYYLAQRRGFAPGGETTDWRLAEAQTDAADEAEA
jgi:hypothetical protein